jgi:hypothetical protein
MTYIPQPLNLDYDEKTIPAGHYTSYKCGIKIDYEVIGHTSKGSNKIRILHPAPKGLKDTCTRLRKNNNFTLNIFDKTTNMNRLVQIGEIYPYHHSKEDQIFQEDNYGVEGEKIILVF